MLGGVHEQYSLVSLQLFLIVLKGPGDSCVVSYNGKTQLDVEQTGCFEMCGTSSTTSWISTDHA